MRLVRLAFWMLYNPLAWTYDGVSQVVSLGRWRDWQRAALPELHGERILELAFGTGNLFADLHEAGYRPVGLDLSASMARLAQRKLRKRGVPERLVRGRAQQLPFAHASFDSVLCTFPAEFILSSQAFSQIARVLRPGGRAVIVLAVQFLDDYLCCRFLEWLYRITGQRGPALDPATRLSVQGLDYRALWKPVDGSAVLVAVLEKQVDDKTTFEYT